ncbi:MAG: hypothetical protein CMK59_09730 [Proteobacteria bacterium]|nr:hypothetical protein [Pseudomonadota bacterium]
MTRYLYLPFLIACAPVDSAELSESKTLELLGSYENDPQYIEGLKDIPSAIDGFNHPSLLSEDFIYTFRDLPLSGHLGYEPWSDSYWPKKDGGIAYRWRVGESHDFTLLTEDEILHGDIEVIANLSPAEKYDIFAGNYDFPLTHTVLSATSPDEASWTGYCHGWTPASSEYKEPNPVVLENEDGVRIPFGSSDVKALLSFYRGEVVTSTYVQHEWRAQTRVIGGWCGSENPSDPSCYDTNPGAFHIALANRIGLEGRDLYLDADISRQKWNQPIYAYETKVLYDRIPSEVASSNAVREYIIQSEVSWTLEIEPMWIPVVNTNHQHTKTQTYLYTLEVDEAGEIVGGQWLAVTDNGSHISLAEAWAYLTTVDENEDGRLDYSEEEASGIIWQYFSIPDYIWTQDDVEFSPEFEHPYNSYELIANSATSRQALYEYFGKLEGLYLKSLQ